MSRNGRLNVWECDTKLDGLIKKNKNEENQDLGVDGDELASKKKPDESMDQDQNDHEDDEEEDKKITIHYKKVAKYGIRDALEANTPVGLLSCDYNKQNRILVSGFSNGSFLLHELPQFNLIHSLR